MIFNAGHLTRLSSADPNPSPFGAVSLLLGLLCLQLLPFTLIHSAWAKNGTSEILGEIGWNLPQVPWKAMKRNHPQLVNGMVFMGCWWWFDGFMVSWDGFSFTLPPMPARLLGQRCQGWVRTHQACGITRYHRNLMKNRKTSKNEKKRGFLVWMLMVYSMMLSYSFSRHETSGNVQGAWRRSQSQGQQNSLSSPNGFLMINAASLQNAPDPLCPCGLFHSHGGT